MKLTGGIWVTCLLAVIPGIGCGGGGVDPGPAEPSPPGYADLAGSWFGVQQPDVGPLQTLSFDADGLGDFTDIRIDGVLQPHTGTFDTLNPYVFGFVTTDGGYGVLWLDATVTRMGWVDDQATVGVLEKGSTALPPGGYDDADLRGVRYGGILVKWSTTEIPGSAGTGFLDVDAGGTFTGGLGTEGFANAGGKTLDCVSTSHGEFFCDLSRPGYGPSYVDLLIGPSKDFVVGRVSEFGSTFPDDYTFFGFSPP